MSCVICYKNNLDSTMGSAIISLVSGALTRADPPNRGHLEEKIMYYNFAKTVDFGNVEIRKSFTEGNHIADIELSGNEFAEIKTDYLTGKLFAVIFDSDWNQK